MELEFVRWLTDRLPSHPRLRLGVGDDAAVLALAEGRDAVPFLAALGMFVLCYVGILISFFPNIVPPSISIREAAAPDSSLAFLLVGALVLIPIILAYTAYAYWVFRGKVDPTEGYH